MPGYEPGSEKNSIINRHGSILHEVYWDTLNLLRMKEERHQITEKQFDAILGYANSVFIKSPESRDFVNTLQDAIVKDKLTHKEIDLLEDELDLIATMVRQEFTDSLDQDGLMLLKTAWAVGPAEKKEEYKLTEWEDNEPSETTPDDSI